MNRYRILALVGVALGVVGLFFPGLSLDSSAVDLLPTLNAANPAFPDGIPTIWGGLDTWAQVVVVIAIIVVVFLAVRPDMSKKWDAMSGGIVAVIGLGLTVYAIVKLFDAGDKADTLQGAFGQAAGAGLIPTSFDVAAGAGFYVLILGTVVVLAAGALTFAGGSTSSRSA